MPTKAELTARLKAIEADEKRLHTESKKLKKAIENKTDRLEVADNENRRENLADQIEAKRAERKQVHKRIEELNARGDKVEEKIATAEEREEEWASEHFRYSEFDTHDGTPVPKAAYPALHEWCEKIGEPARERFGPIGITSGYRHASYNAAIGGATNSIHIYDYPGRDCKAVAVDWYAASGGPKDWFDFTAGRACGRGYYPSSGFHHADTRDNIGWPCTSWSG